MHNIVDQHLSISIARVRSRSRSLVVVIKLLSSHSQVILSEMPLLSLFINLTLLLPFLLIKFHESFSFPPGLNELHCLLSIGGNHC
jgi:hypothetical protein